MLVLFILILTLYWLLGFFRNSIVPGILRAHGFIDVLAVVIILLIMVSFLA